MWKGKVFILGPEGFHEIISNLSYFRFTDVFKASQAIAAIFFLPKICNIKSHQQDFSSVETFHSDI